MKIQFASLTWSLTVLVSLAACNTTESPAAKNKSKTPVAPGISLEVPKDQSSEVVSESAEETGLSVLPPVSEAEEGAVDTIEEVVEAVEASEPEAVQVVEVTLSQTAKFTIERIQKMDLSKSEDFDRALLIFRTITSLERVSKLSIDDKLSILLALEAKGFSDAMEVQTLSDILGLGAGTAKSLVAQALRNFDNYLRRNAPSSNMNGVFQVRVNDSFLLSDAARHATRLMIIDLHLISKERGLKLKVSENDLLGLILTQSFNAALSQMLMTDEIAIKDLSRKLRIQLMAERELDSKVIQVVSYSQDSIEKSSKGPRLAAGAVEKIEDMANKAAAKFASRRQAVSQRKGLEAAHREIKAAVSEYLAMGMPPKTVFERITQWKSEKSRAFSEWYPTNPVAIVTEWVLTGGIQERFNEIQKKSLEELTYQSLEAVCSDAAGCDNLVKAFGAAFVQVNVMTIKGLTLIGSSIGDGIVAAQKLPEQIAEIHDKATDIIAADIITSRDPELKAARREAGIEQNKISQKLAQEKARIFQEKLEEIRKQK